MMSFRKIFLVTVLGSVITSCSEDFLDPELSRSKDFTTSVNTIEDLQGLILGAYDRMNASTYYGRDYVVFAEVRSDNAFSNGNSGRFVSPGQFVVSATDAYADDTWQQIYSVIANTNIVINSQIEGDETDEVQYVKGQAYAIRALAYMDLLRLYGQQYTGGNLGVPIVTEFKNDNNKFPSRATVAEVWNQVGEDLEKAAAIMKPSLDSGSPTEMTTSAVFALQSRYYLNVEDWQNAAIAAKKVIDSQNYDIAPASEFAKSWSVNEGSNSVFELAFTDADNLGNTSLFYIYHETNYGDIEVTSDLYDSYDAADVRKTVYTDVEGVIRTAKYPSFYDNVRVIRYEEVVLNYAEALTHLNDPNALTYLNMIPQNRGASTYAIANVDNVLQERRKELAMEGFRFFDLMRYGRDIVKVDQGQTFADGGISFGSPELAFPIPQRELNANPNIEPNQ